MCDLDVGQAVVGGVACRSVVHEDLDVRDDPGGCARKHDAILIGEPGEVRRQGLALCERTSDADGTHWRLVHVSHADCDVLRGGFEVACR